MYVCMIFFAMRVIVAGVRIEVGVGNKAMCGKQAHSYS